jgi:hypothetical protein
MRLSIERFSWHGIRELSVGAAIDGTLDDNALEALADFLWKNRQS